VAKEEVRDALRKLCLRSHKRGDDEHGRYHMSQCQSAGEGVSNLSSVYRTHLKPTGGTGGTNGTCLWVLEVPLSICRNVLQMS
jgi:hypothetical protein